MSAKKRKRCANFSEDEKMRFLRILQKKGYVIISKVTSHDIQTNRLKEEAWTEITSDLNASGTILRTTENLKKLWQKMKTEAKVFKTNSFNETRVAVGEPSKKFHDPVLEMVAEMTSRGSSGIESDNDCSFGISYANTGLTRRSSTPTLSQSIIDSQSPIEDLPDVSCIEVKIDVMENPSQSVENVDNDMDEIKPFHTNVEEEKPNLKCFKPDVDQFFTNERSKMQLKRIRINNNFAVERLKCEKEKNSILKLQKQHMIQLHALSIKQAQLKTQILEAVLKKIQDEKPVDAALLKAVIDTS